MSQAQVYSFVSNRLASYYTMAQTMSATEVRAYVGEVLSGYMTQETAREKHEALAAAVEERIKKSDSVDEVRVMTLGEYQALKRRNEKCIYLITED